VSTPPTLPGFHHVSAICGDPQANLEFYTGVLGLRLVKRTVNFDDPGTYHLYYGDEVGTPGTLLTFFAWTGIPPLADVRGRSGAGQITAVSLGVPEAAWDAWIDRLAARAVDFHGPTNRFGRPTLVLEDPDGMAVELVAAEEPQAGRPWRRGSVSGDEAVLGLHGIRILVTEEGPSGAFLTGQMGYGRNAEEGGRVLFTPQDGGQGRVVLEVNAEAGVGRMGIGSIHHAAWRTRSDDEQALWRTRLLNAGWMVTPVRDRHYFRSIYFHEPAGTFFEIATDEPGFLVDEEEGELGTRLRLPPWLEPDRNRIEARLPELRLPRLSA
jgi:glyoxalase family protein